MDQKAISFKKVLSALQDDQTPFPPAYLQTFSDIEKSDLAELQNIWHTVSQKRKIALLEDLEELNDNETLVDFSDLCRFLIADPIPSVRASSIRMLWEVQDPKLISPFISIMDKDTDEVVRATAATSLGQFIYLGELEELPSAALSRVEDALLKKVSSADAPLVRRRALESLGFSSRHEVPPLIRKYYKSTDNDWIASALYAMGRSTDPQWQDLILPLLASPEPDIQLEAVRAAGSLEISAARDAILRLMDDPEELDEEVRMAAIWSLSQIGGEDVQELLEKLIDETDDEDEIDFIESAIENLEFNQNLDDLNLLSVDPQTKPDYYKIIDLENDTEENPSPENKPPSKPKRHKK